uniref:Uncharacterized protein n=1 Tax=Setaria italica TaxID=4555 RepID=K4A0N8_SETIT
MARRPRRWRRRSYDGRRRLHVLANDCDRGFSVYELNVDHFDTDVSDSDDDMDSSARRLGNRRLVVRLADGSGNKFLAAGTRIFDPSSPFSSSRPAIVFDTRTRLVTTTPPFQAPNDGPAFWALGRTVYALGCHPVCRRFREGKQPGCFERLGPEPRPGRGKWQWEVLPSPPKGTVEPACKYGKDLLFSKGLKRHLEANLTYLGNAEFCLQETLAPEGESMASTFGLKVRMLLRVVTFRVKYSGDGELCA